MAVGVANLTTLPTGSAHGVQHSEARYLKGVDNLTTLPSRSKN